VVYDGKKLPLYAVSATIGKTENGQKKAIEQRKRVHVLYLENGLSKTQIASQTGLNKQFVINWTKTTDQDLEADNRGWPKGHGRTWDETTCKRVSRIHQELEHGPHEFYSGVSAIQQRYRHYYLSRRRGFPLAHYRAHTQRAGIMNTNQDSNFGKCNE